MKTILKSLARYLGFEITRTSLAHLDTHDQVVLDAVRDYTMTSDERILAVIDSVRYLCRNNIAGAIVECGVWRGGSSMAAALALMQEGDLTRQLILYDTFSGMTPPAEFDVSADGIQAKDQFPSDSEPWCAAGLDDVTANMGLTGYPEHLVEFIVGRVEETITADPSSAPIALLRLDTDWYESTHHELVHLYPRLSRGGVLIIDDYGHWRGAKKAVDDYLKDHNISHFLHRIDYSGRILVKAH